MVDLAGDQLKCRLDRPHLASVVCLMPKKFKDDVREAHGRRVRVEGQGEFSPQSVEPRVIEVRRLVLLPDMPGFDRNAFRRTHDWRELASERGAVPVRDARSLETDVFESDDDFEAFLVSLRTP